MDPVTDADREIRAARNQALFRAVNEKMLELNETFGEIVGTFSVACECARVDCLELLEIPPDAYRAIRESPRTFAVAPGHAQDGIERVVSSHEGYTVVEVLGRGADVHVPFGGIKGSGFGPHEQGEAALEFFGETVTVYVDA
ncbi:MAG: hypothetical protein ABUS54_12175 [Actinomycetota bacterium]